MRETFVEVTRTTPPDHTLIERLSTGRLGRYLAAMRSAQSDIFIGTSNYPVDVSGRYTYYAYFFHEVGPWTELEQRDNQELSMLVPALASPLRTSLLESRALGDQVPVYVLYIYHAVSFLLL
jgi:hypothetical protein